MQTALLTHNKQASLSLSSLVTHHKTSTGWDGKKGKNVYGYHLKEVWTSLLFYKTGFDFRNYCLRSFLFLQECFGPFQGALWDAVIL